MKCRWFFWWKKVSKYYEVLEFDFIFSLILILFSKSCFGMVRDIVAVKTNNEINKLANSNNYKVEKLLLQLTFVVQSVSTISVAQAGVIIDPNIFYLVIKRIILKKDNKSKINKPISKTKTKNYKCKKITRTKCHLITCFFLFQWLFFWSVANNNNTIASAQ